MKRLKKGAGGGGGDAGRKLRCGVGWEGDRRDLFSALISESDNIPPSNFQKLTALIKAQLLQPYNYDNKLQMPLRKGLTDSVIKINENSFSGK